MGELSTRTLVFVDKYVDKSVFWQDIYEKSRFEAHNCSI